MKIISQNQALGDAINLKISREKHITGKQMPPNYNDKVTDNFSTLFNKALNEVNNLELKATDIANQMAVNPDSVNIHDVQIAAEQAEMAVMLTKGITDRAIRAYKEITSVR